VCRWTSLGRGLAALLAESLWLSVGGMHLPGSATAAEPQSLRDIRKGEAFPQRERPSREVNRVGKMVT